ncbi:MAG TPA: glycosyltransferase family 4 protein, partial [Pyrinomonadaceae bacterium]
AFVGWRNKIPTIGFQKGFEYNGKPNRFVLRSGWYDHHVACSNAIANCLFELGLPRERCSIMYDGVAPPPDGFDAERRTDRAPVISMYSLLQEWKGQDVFLKAVAKVVKKYAEPFRVVIAGDSPDGSREFPDHLKALAAELGIADRVDFRGHIRNVWQLLAETDIAVHASTKPEPFGTVVAEAMIAGVAVIATKGGGVAEYVTPGETGLQVEMGDVDAMAQAIERLLRDAELRRSLAQRGRDFALKEFRPSLYAERMTELYQRVLASRN